MCGILWRLRQRSSLLEENSSNISVDNEGRDNTPVIPEWLSRRGPDSIGLAITVQDCAILGGQDDPASHESLGQLDGSKGCRQELLASVLQMRGELQAQPVTIVPSDAIINLAGTTELLCINETFEKGITECSLAVAWNGELYEVQTNTDLGGQSNESTLQDATNWNDSAWVATEIQALWQALPPQEDPSAHFPVLLASFLERLVNAEYAIVMSTPNALYFARDPLGRRSLLMGGVEYDDERTLHIQQVSSVSNYSLTAQTWREVPPGRLYSYRFSDQRLDWQPIVLYPVTSTVTLPTTADDASLHLEHLLQQAVRRRLPAPLLQSATTGNSRGSGLSILFSGGLDSVVLAGLVLLSVAPGTPVYLINVSFIDGHNSGLEGSSSTKTTSKPMKQNNHPPPTAADTKAALESYEQLQEVFPEHSASVHLIQKQADWGDISAVEKRVRALLYPKDKMMDLNVATALWFAAQAAADASHSRVLMSGLGADEQMGGYGRHRKTDDLRAELDMDMARLWDRNLGRDDRVLSDAGQEARYPFLDVHVVQYLARLPLDLVCDFSLPPGEGDKLILRRVAHRLGLTKAGGMVKRAIQFGSRISHVCDKRRYGSRRKATRGLNQGN